MLEAKVHAQLRALLRQQGETPWPHHLTLARLVARALRLGRSALLQIGPTALHQGHYRLSYLISILLSPSPVILVVPAPQRHQVQWQELPRLQQWLGSPKAIVAADTWPHPGFNGILLVSPAAWIAQILAPTPQFPQGVPVVVDGGDDLEDWLRQAQSVTVTAQDWEALLLACPQAQDWIRAVRVRLTHRLFQRPPNPYGCHPLEGGDRQELHQLLSRLGPGQLPLPWEQVQRHTQGGEGLLWGAVQRDRGHWTLHAGPILASFPPQSPLPPLVLIAGAVDPEGDGSDYRQRLGLGDMTCLKFAPDRHQEMVQLYLADRLPLPNTPEFRAQLLGTLGHLLVHPMELAGLAVVLVGDVPLKAQVGSALAAQFGSQVRVESLEVPADGILVAGWDWWLQHQGQLPAPRLLALATLPFPSLEDPQVAARVALHKQRRQDWFRLYLLPTALVTLQRAIARVRDRQGLVALLDNRVSYRSYGSQILAALSPAAQVKRLDPPWLSPHRSSLG